MTKAAMYLKSSDLMIINIIPMYVGSLITAQLFCCLWHLVAKNSLDQNNWLVYYDYKEEHTLDKFWASMYYIYSTFTTTGYGDISPHTNTEFAMTIIMMILGIVFYSFLYSTIINKLDERRRKNQLFTEKLDTLESVKKAGMVKESSVFSLMVQVIEDHRQIGMESNKLPDFKNVRPADKKQLLIEMCKREHHFDKIPFF